MSAVSPPVSVRRRIDWVRLALGLLTAIVLVFLFVPIGLVVLHSFNRGNNFSIWSNHVSTKWWGDLFVAGRTIRMIVVFGAIVAVSLAVPRVVALVVGRKITWLSRWALPAGLALAVVVNGLSTGWYRDLFNNPSLGSALRNSFIAAFGGTVIAVFLGGFAGVALARRPGWWTKPFMLVVFLILVTPEIMDAIALLGWMVKVLPGHPPFNKDIPIPVFGNWKINYGIVRLWVGQSMYSSAVVTLIVRARLAGLDESLEEAAADLGAPPGRAFRQITLPLIMSALVAGALLSFTLCLDNTIISNYVSTAGSSTFPVFVLGTLKSTTKPFVAVAAVVLFGVTLASLAFVGTVLKRSGDSSSQIAATLAGG
jgi:ABC-type spermidine/putrescine transport system permease subunit II